MPRSRTVKGGFFRSPDIQHTPVDCRLLFISLWTQADRDGRLEDLPWKIREEAFPYDQDITEQHVDVLLDTLDRRDLIRRYVVDGQPLIYVTKWRSHQHPHPKEAKSELPEPPEPLANARQLRRQLPDAGDPVPGNGSVHTQVRTDRARTSNTSLSSKPSSTSGSSKPSAHHRHGGGSSSSRACACEDAPLAAAGIATALRAWERERGKMARGVTASHPHVLELADLHVCTDELRRAYDAAVADREATGDIAAINAGFVRVFVDKQRNPQKPREDNGWRRTPSGIERKASELGIVCPPGRDYAWLAEKCDSVIRQRANGTAS